MTETTTNEQSQLSLGTAAARNLATTTKSAPQMQEITSRHLLRVLPWVQASGGTYRVNRRLSYTVGDGRVTFYQVNPNLTYAVGDGRLTFTEDVAVRVIPAELCELPALRGYEDAEVLAALASRFVQHHLEPGDPVPEEQVVLIAHGKVNKTAVGEYGNEIVRGVLASGQFLGDFAEPERFSARAITSCIVLTLSSQSLQEVVDQAESLYEHLDRPAELRAQNAFGEAEIELASGHTGEAVLPGTFVDYDLSPREYELSVAQTVLRIHTRVADLYNEPMNQTEQQLRLTIEALRERQEHELVNNRDFGLLHNADLKQRIHTRGGPPTPDDLDDLLGTVWKDPSVILAHPRALAAFARQCNSSGIYPTSVDVGGNKVVSWRGVPMLPCNKIPVTSSGLTSMMVMRMGEDNQGVIGLHRTGLVDEYQPGVSVRFMGINDKAIISYLVSTYYSAAVLVPDALGILESVEVN